MASKNPRVDPKILWNIQWWVEDVALLEEVDRFYPSAVTSSVECSIKDAFICLLHLVEDDRLELNWEVRCHCNAMLFQVDKLPSDAFIGTKHLCPECSDQAEVALGSIYPVFRVRPEYRKFVIDNQDKSPLLRG